MYVFISHSHEDIDKARALGRMLDELAIPYFLDVKDIEWGSEITPDVQAAINKATHFVILVSRAAVESEWVSFELGIAEGLRSVRGQAVRILPWVVSPVPELPAYLSQRMMLTSTDEIRARFAAYRDDEEKTGKGVRIASQFAFAYAGMKAPALRLVGAADEEFPATRLRVVPHDQPYRLPDDMLLTKADILARLERDAAQRKAPFFDGPHTRLIDYEISDVDPSTEQKGLTLHVGPIGWYDYAVARWYSDRIEGQELSKYILVQEIADTGSIARSRLSNILDTATTLVTSDGVLMYSDRGERVTVAEHRSTSAVAENIHQDKDGSLRPPVDSDLPAPFMAVWRGIEEELSPAVARVIRAARTPVRCLGLSFDLVAFHPDLLFFAALPLSFADVMRSCTENPGKDFFEGQLRGFSLVDGGRALDRELSRDNWTGGGKASVFRALEFIDSHVAKSRRPLLDVLATLRRPAD